MEKSEIRKSERRRRRRRRQGREDNAVSAMIWQKQRKRRREAETQRGGFFSCFREAASETGGELCELQNKSVKRVTQRGRDSASESGWFSPSV